jgi:molybdate transport system permease protein
MDILPIIVTMKTASLSIFITFFLGLFAAKLIVQIRSNAFKNILDGILILPLVLPPTVAGFMLLYTFGVRRPIGKFLLDFFSIKIAFSWGATVLAAVVMSFPLMYRSARGAFEQVDQNLIYAARTLGMSEWKIFWCVIMPVAKPGVIGGGILAFARGMGEFGATTMIAGNIAGKTRTLPLAVYSAVAAGDMRTAGSYVLIILILSLIIIISMNYFISQEHFENHTRRLTVITKQFTHRRKR